MPIFTDSRSFSHYRPRAIEEKLVRAMGCGESGQRIGVGSAIIRLECYLQITRQSLTMEELATEEGEAKISGYVGALFSSRFESAKRCVLFGLAGRLRKSLEAAGATSAAKEIAESDFLW